MDKDVSESFESYFGDLKDLRIESHKFVREYVIGNYIADFVCREKKLIIEVDGGQHMTAEAYDQQRTKDLEAQLAIG